MLPLSNRSASLRGGNEQTRRTFKAACSNALLAHKSLRWLQPTVRSLMRVFKLKRRATSRSSVTPWSSRSRSKVEQRHWQIVGLTSFSLRVWSSLAGSATVSRPCGSHAYLFVSLKTQVARRPTIVTYSNAASGFLPLPVNLLPTPKSPTSMSNSTTAQPQSP